MRVWRLESLLPKFSVCPTVVHLVPRRTACPWREIKEGRILLSSARTLSLSKQYKAVLMPLLPDLDTVCSCKDSNSSDTPPQSPELLPRAPRLAQVPDDQPQPRQPQLPARCYWLTQVARNPIDSCVCSHTPVTLRAVEINAGTRTDGCNE